MAEGQGNKKQLQNRKRSAVKAVRVSARRHVFNARRAKAVKDVTKDFSKLIAGKKTAEAAKLLPQAFQAIDKAVKRGILKKNTAARMKSALAKRVA